MRNTTWLLLGILVWLLFFLTTGAFAADAEYYKEIAYDTSAAGNTTTLTTKFKRIQVKNINATEVAAYVSRLGTPVSDGSGTTTVKLNKGESVYYDLNEGDDTITIISGSATVTCAIYATAGKR